ncbi:HPr kinase/phosphorylase [Collibacillus ludicampi]|jgi:HPr kinase/phosphorylase|uniref:HPr kinase/phosphorylase n=2 Tax=Collibacillus ludicampi TaxID=2771369 RepID=A0AAV4LBV8_9BACL|nr:HPr kinase/phosphorylase [Collibacillus ludicampi]
MGDESQGMGKIITTEDLIHEFRFEQIVPDAILDRPITGSDMNRPGLLMAGFLKFFPEERIQLLGRTEISFFEQMTERKQWECADRLCRHPETPCIIVSRQMEVPEILIEVATRYRLPILRSRLATTKLAGQLQRFLEHTFAPETQMHGVLVDVYGIGILITGNSGIGKSETALELIKRGHRLVADDAVVIRQVEENTLYGESPELLNNLLEIRGLGILNAMTLFGAGAVRAKKKIELVIHLEAWRDDVAYDRLGLDEHTVKILDTEIPSITLPVRPGRNLAVIIEVAAMNQRLKMMGYNAAKELSEKLMATIENHDE